LTVITPAGRLYNVAKLFSVGFPDLIDGGNGNTFGKASVELVNGLHQQSVFVWQPLADLP
jgi:hypothetical protein